MSENLEALRYEIDTIDKAILQLLEKREQIYSCLGLPQSTRDDQQFLLEYLRHQDCTDEFLLSKINSLWPIISGEKFNQEFRHTDAQILNLLEKRQQTVTAVGNLKKEKAIPVTDPSREKVLTQNLQEICQNGELRERIPVIWNAIMNMSKEHQRNQQK